MKKFLTFTLVFILALSCLPGVAAFGATFIPSGLIYNPSTTQPDASLSYEGNTTHSSEPIIIKPNAGGGVPGVPEPEDSNNLPYVEPPWKLILNYNEDGEKTASAAAYLVPVSDDGIYGYAPGSWLTDQMLNKLDSTGAQQLSLELSAGYFSPVNIPAFAPYTGGEADEPVYSAKFALPTQDEGRTFPDDDIALVLKFPGYITVIIPAQELSSAITAVDLKLYSDRLVLDLVDAEDAEAYINVSCAGTPVWIDAEGNEIEAGYEYDEASGVYKIAVKPGLPLVFKA